MNPRATGSEHGTGRDQRVNTRVVFIGGAGHSGSTLLGLMLGAHPDVFFAGETDKVRHLGNPSSPPHKRACRLCGPGCLVWDDLQETNGRDIYDALSEHTGRPIVVDSSKNLSWIKRRIAALEEEVPLHLIICSRDGRAVVNSFLRNAPETSARDHAVVRASLMRAAEEFASSFAGRYTVCATRSSPLDLSRPCGNSPIFSVSRSSQPCWNPGMPSIILSAATSGRCINKGCLQLGYILVGRVHVVDRRTTGDGDQLPAAGSEPAAKPRTSDIEDNNRRLLIPEAYLGGDFIAVLPPDGPPGGS
ncbi:MAG: sulfotransferase [Actinomycetota bacterium]